MLRRNDGPVGNNVVVKGGARRAGIAEEIDLDRAPRCASTAAREFSVTPLRSTAMSISSSRTIRAMSASVCRPTSKKRSNGAITQLHVVAAGRAK